MKNILAIFKADVRGLVKNVLALIIIIGLCILPSLYAWFNIYSNWDPYANTGNIKIAAYSEDEGYTGEDGTVQNMGGKILDNLKENTAIGWTMVNSGEEAIEGVKSGDYYAAVVIEKDFSYKMFNMFAEGFANPGITYYENEKKNAVATKITDTAVSTLQQSIDAQFVDVVIRTVFEQTNNVSGEIETNNKIKEFTDKLTAVNNNLITYETTIESLISANKELTTSVGKAQDEIDSLKGQVDTGIDDVTGVQNGISTTRTSLSDFNAKVKESVAQIESSLDKVVSELENTTVTDDVRKMADDMIQTMKDVNTLKKEALKLEAAIKGIKLPSDYDKETQDALNAIGSVIGNADDIREVINGLGITDAADKVTSRIEAELAKKTDSVEDAVRTCKDYASNMRNMFTNSLMPQIDGILANTEQILATVNTLLESINTTLENTGTIFDGMVSTIGSTNQSLEQMQVIIQGVSEKLKSVTELFNGTTEDERVQALRKLMSGDPDTYGEFFSEPVKIDTVEVYPIANYGSAMTPFYTVLALWVGALLLTALVKVKAEPKNLQGVKLHQLYFGRYLLFFVLGQIQALVVVLGDIYLLHCQILDKGLFWFTASLTSFVFTLLVYSLTLSFGDIGKAVAVVIMVIQIAGSGGTFPIELLPSVYRNIYIFFPFPYAINAMRETIGGMYGNMYVKSLLQLMIFAVAALVLGLVIRKPFIKWNHFVEKRMEDTKMM
ncbi:yhgE/Pip N-terminal domain/YhgE/Pip C-terminal domain [Butyrivibrio sp. CAG:318]|nr:yhgE/Pip N-terminal domain/YhgE/Pip C-terminal domain [Butyrivibrio sp. CAG:318]